MHKYNYILILALFIKISFEIEYLSRFLRATKILDILVICYRNSKLQTFAFFYWMDFDWKEIKIENAPKVATSFLVNAPQQQQLRPTHAIKPQHIRDRHSTTSTKERQGHMYLMRWLKKVSKGSYGRVQARCTCQPSSLPVQLHRRRPLINRRFSLQQEKFLQLRC